ncbi:MAG: 3-isopropylmalate dehydratase small subunit [Alphaproteobacteria bacterium CG11_big_fil_rev_8_21_14_0_20_44_7]|nr:MAG: 3-isopropylmalate dehydratase small subunit [Alphaproteobacteria bacterium CG11_big_fil_rev_8_21_14_0_20_44_7]
MQKFTKITAIIAPLPLQNVDTDMIIPKQFLKTIKRSGLAEGLFYEMRFDEKGNRVDDFVLHNAPYTNAKILVSGENFGCGSSREHAPWALLDFGIKVIIAPSFADIFYNNCFKNGMLPIKLPQSDVDQITEVAKRGEEVSIDLEAQTVSFGNTQIKFQIDGFRKHNLLNGLDDIGLTLQNGNKISEYEAEQKQTTPWQYEYGTNYGS